MSFCDHCEGQRFDRAQVLRLLRATRKNLQEKPSACQADEALRDAIKAVRAMSIPHIEPLEDMYEDGVVH